MSDDLISRQAAIDAIRNIMAISGTFDGEILLIDKAEAQTELMMLPSAQTEPQWIPCSERLPDDLAEVNVTWVNTNPKPYYDFVKDKPATGSAVYHRGEWYWYSSVTVDVLAEYGRMESEKMDDAIKVIAWMPLPEPYKGEQE